MLILEHCVWHRGLRVIGFLHNNPGVKEAENNQQCNRRSVPEYREQEQSVNTDRRVIAHLDPEYRAREQFANTERQATACKDEEVREAENEQQCNRRSVPEYREWEQSVNTQRKAVAREAGEEVKERENEQRHNRRSDPEYRKHEQEQSVNTRSCKGGSRCARE